ncbi:hypothetical protein TNCV_362561 [Trichonephila clavipes]|nr:hypothetical protein TNCV_362561 [Trichonephila clavipes]
MIEGPRRSLFKTSFQLSALSSAQADLCEMTNDQKPINVGYPSEKSMVVSDSLPEVTFLRQYDTTCGTKSSRHLLSFNYTIALICLFSLSIACREHLVDDRSTTGPSSPSSATFNQLWLCVNAAWVPIPEQDIKNIFSLNGEHYSKGSYQPWWLHSIPLPSSLHLTDGYILS